MPDEWNAALPDDPLSRHAVGTHPRARVGFTEGTLAVADVALEPPDAVQLAAPLDALALRMRNAASGVLPVTDVSGVLLGAVYLDDLLRAVAEQRPAGARELMSALVPACRPESTLLDALREMLTCYLRRLPVVDGEGRLLGQLPLAEAVAAADRDPAIRDLLSSVAHSPSLWARRWR